LGWAVIISILVIFTLISITTIQTDVFAEVTDQDKKPMDPKEEQIKQEDLAKIEEVTYQTIQLK